MGNNRPNFQSRLKEIRKERGYKKQQDLADALYRSIDTIQNWEQGKTLPTMGDFIELCNFFNCDADYLLGRIDEKTHALASACELTGLEEKTVERVQWLIGRENRGKEINAFLSAENSNVFFSKLKKIGDVCEEIDNALVIYDAFWKEPTNEQKAYAVFNFDNSKRLGDLYRLAIYDLLRAAQEVAEELYNGKKAEKNAQQLEEKYSDTMVTAMEVTRSKEAHNE